MSVVEGRAKTWDVPEGRWLIVGRDPACDVVLEASGVSRRHARIKLGEVVEVEDLQSANGTAVDDRLLTPGTVTAVGDNVQLSLGPALLVVARGQPRAPEEGTMAQILEWVERVADSELPVVFTGETGVGKSRLARTLHGSSARCDGPFVVVDCAALASNLIEDTLFGHVRGAFTGAVSDRKGALEAASSGTVFLDEIGDLPLPAQGKLLRVLQEREVTRLGAERPCAVDVRFVAATHRSLEEAVGVGAFREDLYHRLTGLVLRVPPLRRRHRELPELCRTLIHELAPAKRPTPSITTDGIEWLAAQPWPGNIRELRNVLHRALVLHRDGDLDAQVLSRFSSVEPRPASAEEPAGASLSEQERVAAALRECGGNQTRAARLLGMTRRQLVYRVAKYGLPRPRGESRDP